MSALVKAELAATCSTLGRSNAAGQYVVDPQCYESVRDLIRFLRRDDCAHQVRLYLGSAKVLLTDLVPIVAVSSDAPELFDITIRLLVNLTNPVILLYKEELPAEKVGRNIYMRLIGYSQEYKVAFCNVEFWKAVMSKLTELFQVDWSDRSEDSSLLIERILVLLRNVLQVPADTDLERRPDNDITVHDKVLWALRESQLLELLLYVSSNRDEEKYFLHLLEIFSLVLREQSPAALAQCELGRSAIEKQREASELLDLREKEKYNSKNFKNTRSFAQTFVLKNVKSISENEVVYHKSLDKLNDLKLTQDKKRVKISKQKFPEDSERVERRSTFSVRLFLKEFCVELLSCSFNRLIGVVKDKLVSGKGLANDESYYFWALRFFMEFSRLANVDVKLISECINVQTFHYVQTQIDNCYDHMQTEKKKLNIWVRRLHLTLKAYRSLLNTLLWMDSSKDANIREMSKVLKSNLFYVPEYRELMLNCLFKYDSAKFPISFLRDLIETNHLNLKLLENYCKNSKIVVQKKKRVTKKRSKKSKAASQAPAILTPEQHWERVKDQVFKVIEDNVDIPEVVPFDAASDEPIDEQKEQAMKNIQRKLRSGEASAAVGLLRSSRQVWPENDIFGSVGMSLEDEVMALQEVCMAELGVVYEVPVPEESSSEEESDDDHVEVTETNYNIEDYVKKLVHKKVVEGCCILLGNYKKNLASTNHCAIKLLHRVGWQCKAPAMMYQASFFITLNKILLEKNPSYKEMQQFAKELFKKFRHNVAKNPKVFIELLFWKDPKIAFEIEEGYGTSEAKEHKGTWAEEEEDELKRLWVEFDMKMLDGDKIDWIKNNLINQSRSRLGIIKKLKELMLIAPGTRVNKKTGVRGGAEWSEEETALLSQLYEQHKDAMDTAQMITDRMRARSKKSIKDKLVEMGLVSCLADLRKKRPKKSSNNRNAESSPERMLDSSSADESDGEHEVETCRYSVNAAVAALKTVESMKLALEWLKETFTECIEDDEDSNGYPLLPLDGSHSDALDNPDFKEVLRKLDMMEPIGEQQVYWKIRGNKLELHDRLELVKAAIEGKLDEISIDPEIPQNKGRNRVSDESDSEDDFVKLRKVLPSSTQDKTSHRTADEFFDNMKSAGAINNSSRQLAGLAVDSDRSDNGDASGEEMTQVKSKPRISKPSSAKKRGRRRRAMGSDDSDSASSSSPDDVIVSKASQKKSEQIDLDSDRSDNVNFRKKSKPRRSSGRDLDSDRSDKGGASGEEMSPLKKSIPHRSVGRDLDSDRSNEAGPLGEETSPVKTPIPRRSAGRDLDSDRSDEAGVSGEEMSPVKKPIPRRSAGRDLDSDRSDEAGVSGEEMLPVKKPIPRRSAGRDLDSDRSDEGGASGEEMFPAKKLPPRRLEPVASDSEGESLGGRDLWRQKRRRCIGSDSEVEGYASDENMQERPAEVRKKSRLIGSDSEVEGQGSLEDLPRSPL